MKDLIEALQIVAKYSDVKYPTTCEHGVMYVLVDPFDVPDEEKDKLEELGFSANEEERRFYSRRFGAA